MKKTIIILWILLTAVLGYGQYVKEATATTSWQTSYDTTGTETSTPAYFRTINLINNSTSSTDTLLISYSYNRLYPNSVALKTTSTIPVKGGESFYIVFVDPIAIRYVYVKAKSGTISYTLICTQ